MHSHQAQFFLFFDVFLLIYLLYDATRRRLTPRPPARPPL